MVVAIVACGAGIIFDLPVFVRCKSVSCVRQGVFFCLLFFKKNILMVVTRTY